MVANVKVYAMQFLFYILYIMRCYYSRRFFEWNLGEENVLQHPLSDTRYKRKGKIFKIIILCLLLFGNENWDLELSSFGYTLTKKIPSNCPFICFNYFQLF